MKNISPLKVIFAKTVKDAYRNFIISSTELIKEKYIIGFNQTMQTVSYKKETKKCP